MGSVVLRLIKRRFCRNTLVKRKKNWKSVLGQVKGIRGCKDLSGGSGTFRKDFEKFWKFWIFLSAFPVGDSGGGFRWGIP